MDTQKETSAIEVIADVTKPEEVKVSSPDDKEISVVSISESSIADIQQGQDAAASIDSEKQTVNPTKGDGSSNAPVASGSAGLIELMDIDEFFGEPISEINQDGDVIDLDSDEPKG